MGRSTGSHGGSGGGFSGGGRSSGGFSGGSRSGGRSRTPSGGGFGMGMPPMGYPRMRPPRPRYPRRPASGGFWRGMLGGMVGSSLGGGQGRPSAPAPSTPPPDGGPRPSSAAARGGCGCGTLFIAVCALLLVLTLATSFGCAPRGCSGPGAASHATATSTRQRTALPAGTAEVTPFYTDEDGDWIHDTAQLEAGMDAFWRATGVRPYVYILPNGSVTSTQELTRLAEDLYDENFDDEGHFVLVFCDNGHGGYNCGYSVGAQARSVLDDEAVQVLAKQLDRAYADGSLSEEEIFSQAFERTAQEIMADPQEGRRAGLYLAAGLGVCIVGAGGYMLYRRHREKEEERARHLDEVLERPLETFGDADLADLEKKYADKKSDTDDDSA